MAGIRERFARLVRAVSLAESREAMDAIRAGGPLDPMRELYQVRGEDEPDTRAQYRLVG